MAAWNDRIRWGVIEDARGRHRRERGVIAAAAAAVAVAVVAAVLLQSVGGGGSHPASASVRGRQAAHPAVLASCAITPPKDLQGPPSQSLLSILGVLRRPATPADALPPGIQALGGFTREVYVNYIRRARVIGGISYYIFPAVVGGCGQPTRAGIAELAAHVPSGHGDLGSDSTGGITAAQIEDGRDFGSGPPGSSTSCTVTMVVPDGVASVTLHFPAGPANGFHKNIISPAATVTTHPVGNFLAVTVPRSGGTIGPATTMTWRDANGHVIKTLTLP